ncbi:MAG: ferritin-like domain-containing protein [Deltaproteobacteria bacterium]|nr:ferritin-like domain-containing protein [Deltaproteobacteria bacterium]MCW5808461.1 ferritin-like domain-containing protein [Deltaproteobacteria bacterium]
MRVGELEIGFLGGWTERRMHRRRRIADDLPWGTLDLSAYRQDELVHAREVWTNGVFTEYASAAAFSQLATAFIECGAPIDLTATCADIVVDEIAHVELVSRVVVEIGGAVPYALELDKITQLVDPEAPALLRAAELAVTTSCVGESLSVPALQRSRTLTTNPLMRGVLDRLVRDEGPHAQLGPRFLAWANPRMTDDHRAWLARVALDAIAVYAPLWQGEVAADVANGLGVADDDGYQGTMTAAVRDKIAGRLERCGIHLDPDRLAELL